jgi:hypothetical protein
MKTLQIISLASAFIFASVAAAEERPLDLSLLGLGSHSCSQWVDYGLQPKSKSSPYEQWFLGAVTGHNLFYHPKSGSSFLSADEINLVKFFFDYCSANPELKVSDALLRFFAKDLIEIRNLQNK